MSVLIIVNNTKDWPLEIADAEVVDARTYISNAAFHERRDAKIFNLCRSYRYQSLGYYVSLLAGARGHRPLPSINTIQDMKSQTITRFVSDDLFELIQRSLAPIKSDEFVLSIYFGRNLAKRYERLSLALYNLYPAPLLRARFIHNKNWQLQSISPIATNDIPEEHKDFLLETASAHFSGKGQRLRKRQPNRYDVAILHNPNEVMAPSDSKALRKFVKAGQKLNLYVELINKDDYGRLAEFDALFIRETTNVNHHTYRFARRAAAEGLVVIDDPDSILKCTNKVYLAELLNRYRIPTPKTTIVTKHNLRQIETTVSMPSILKQPDSAFSQGVIKVNNVEEFHREAARLLEKSELVLAQEYLPTDFDWRVGILRRQAIYVCKYYMAGQHWQIVQRDASGRFKEGKAETLALADAPKPIIDTALRAANLIGDGLYGVDLKQVGSKVYVIEINDNPNIDTGVEDKVLKDELYHIVMNDFVARIEERKLEKRPG